MTRRRRSDEGSAIVEFAWLGILLLVPLIYIVVAVFEVQRTAYAASAAARSAGRAFVTSPTEASAQARAQAAARLAFSDQGIPDAPVDLVLRCEPNPGNCLAPGSVITAEVNSSVVLPFLPAVLGDQAPSFRVDAVHQAPYGTFREDRP